MILILEEKRVSLPRLPDISHVLAAIVPAGRLRYADREGETNVRIFIEIEK